MSAFRNSHKCQNVIIKHCSLQFKDFQVLWRISSVFSYFQFSAPNSTTISDLSSTLSTQWRILQLIWLRENTGQGQLHDSRQLINFIIKSSSLQPKSSPPLTFCLRDSCQLINFIIKSSSLQPKSSPPLTFCLRDSCQLINFIIKSSSLQPNRVRIALHLWPFVSDIVILVLKGTLTDN